MSRIKGVYKWLRAGGSPSFDKATRWLDTNTGCTYESETSAGCMGAAFKPLPDGIGWCNSCFIFTPDIPQADWYVLRHVPEGVFCGAPRPASTQCDGPFVEAVARTQAIMSVKQHRGRACKVSVVQIKQGDTYSKVTPATPEPTYNWS